MCPWVAFKVLQVQKTAIGNGVHVTSDLKNKWAQCIMTMGKVHGEDWHLAYSHVVLYVWHQRAFALSVLSKSIQYLLRLIIKSLKIETVRSVSCMAGTR